MTVESKKLIKKIQQKFLEKLKDKSKRSTTVGLRIVSELFGYIMWLVVWVYGISTFVGYLMSNPFLNK